MSNQKDKAKELVEKFKSFVHCTSSWNEYDDYLELENAKQCAKIAVEEIINNSVLNYSGSDFSDNEIMSDTEYWNEVLKEIDLL